MLLLLFSFVSLFVVVHSSNKSFEYDDVDYRKTRNLLIYPKSIVGTTIEKLYQYGVSWQEQAPILDQCTEGESQTSNATVLFNFRGRPDDLTDDDVTTLADAFLSAYEDLGADVCFEVLDVSIDTSQEVEEEEDERMLALLYEASGTTRALQNNATNETTTPIFSFNFSLFFFILFRCFFCPSGAALLTNDASRRRLRRNLLQQIDELIPSTDLLKRENYHDQIHEKPYEHRSLRINANQNNRRQQHQQNGGDCSISGNDQQQQQQGSGCNNKINGQQQQQQNGGGSGSSSSNGEQHQKQLQQDGDSISSSINGDQQQQQKQCNANRLENCKGPARDTFRGKYNEVLRSLRLPPESVDEIIDAVELQKYPCNPIVNKVNTSVVIVLQGDYNYLLQESNESQGEIEILQRALKKTYNTMNTANRETCDLQFRRVTRFRFVRGIRLSNNSFSMSFNVTYRCRDCETFGGLFHNVVDANNDQRRENFNVDFREKGPVEPPCTCAIDASLFRAPTPQEFTKVLQDMINVRKGQKKLYFIIGVDSNDATSEAIAVLVTPMPTAPVPVAVPTSTPQCSSSGCCSQNFASCVSWCGTLSTESECLACNQDLHWICGEQQNCKVRWDDCTTDKDGCCDGLTCVDDNPSYSQCRYVEGQTPIASPTSPEPTLQPIEDIDISDPDLYNSLTRAPCCSL